MTILKTVLHEYQKDAVRFILDSTDIALIHAVMGAGKTLIALTAWNQYCDDHPSARALVICPKSVSTVFHSQVSHHFKGMRAHLHKGAGEVLPKTGLVVTTYERCVHLLDKAFDVVILDEVHLIRNKATQRFDRVSQIVSNSLHVWGFTGTVVVNKLTDLMAMAYLKGITVPHIKRADWIASHRYQILTGPELPEATIEEHEFKMSVSERMDYLGLTSAAVIGLIAQRRAHASRIVAKINYIKKLRGSVVVFSSHVTALKKLRDALGEGELFTGDTSPAMRTEITDDFNAGRIRVLLVGYMAGGVGVSFIGAEHVVLNDPPWNKATEDQAIARVWRQGLDHPITVHKLKTRNTVERWVSKLVNYKGDLMDHEYESKAEYPEHSKVQAEIATDLEKVEST